MKDAKQTLWDLIIGIAAYIVLVCIIGGILADNKWNFILGVIYGGLLSLFLVFHMFRSLDRTLDFDRPGAEKYTRRMSAMRMGIMAVAIGAAVFLSAYIHMIGVILGMMALKLSAYIQPIIRKFITAKIYNKGR